MSHQFWFLPQLLIGLCVGFQAVADVPPKAVPTNRVATVLLSQDFVNEQFTAHTKNSELLKEMKLELNKDRGVIYLRGKLQVPVEELRAINLDPKMGLFRFQVSIKPQTTKQGYLILEFPLSETYFYPVDSDDPVHDRVIIPVQLLSLALASARGYLAALSGDFSGFERRVKKLNLKMRVLRGEIAKEKDPDALDELKTEKEALRLQIEALPIERRQLQDLAKQYGHLLKFTGEKELNLNDELGARKNALVIKIKIAQLVPYLTGVDLGGVRLVHDKKDGENGQNYLAIDVNSDLGILAPPLTVYERHNRQGLKVAPAMVVRLNQSLFESQSIMSAEQKAGDNVQNLSLQLKDDGLHVSGKYHRWFVSVPFDTVVDFVSTAPDLFEIRIRQLQVAGMNLEFMTKTVLDFIKHRFETALRGLASFKYVGREDGRTRAIQVSIQPKNLVPAFPDLHLVGVDVRDQEFLLKVGHL